MGRISSFFANARRVLRLTKKPKKDEFLFVAKVTALGVALLGIIGYLIQSIRFLF